ncbi:MAG: hypothetical protein M3N68_01185 [Actinomycetota bacterium]|nr:hypothetical protein [Actinomycetota bacterium]
MLERTERTVKRSADVTREVGTWPGGRQAVLVRWTEQQPRPGGPDAAPSLRNWQLLLEVNDGLILNVLATAPVSASKKRRWAPCCAPSGPGRRRPEQHVPRNLAIALRVGGISMILAGVAGLALLAAVSSRDEDGRLIPVQPGPAVALPSAGFWRAEDAGAVRARRRDAPRRRRAGVRRDGTRRR